MKRKPSERVVYQIYPKSFKDSNDDGFGDLRGIIEKLDYLARLGIDMIWLTPFYVSPGNDNGYDVADYYHVDPRYGTDQDIVDLIAAAKERDIDVMLDMVFNHTSTDHAWFQQAVRGDASYQDYYFFRDQPTNWESKFGGNAWHYVENQKLYYLHLFDVSQADLNWHNPQVFQGICDVVNYWLEKGVMGLRFDVINLISKPAVFSDDEQGDGRRFYTDGPHVHELIANLNQATFGQHPEVITVGELSSTTIANGVQYAGNGGRELTTIFNFHHLKVDYRNHQKWEIKPADLLELKKILRDWQLAMQEADALMALFWCNHDQPRVVSRFGNDTVYAKQSAKMLATLMQLMRGMPYIYQGEEIGLTNAYFKALSSYRDVESLNMAEMLKATHSDEEIMTVLQARSRDNARTPMPWNHDPHFGFSAHEPWIPFANQPVTQTVEDALADADSVFYYYQKLIQLRKSSEIIQDGTIEFIDFADPYLFNYIRSIGNHHLVVINNFQNETREYELLHEHGKLVLSNYDEPLRKKMILQPYHTLVYEVNENVWKKKSD